VISDIKILNYAKSYCEDAITKFEQYFELNDVKDPYYEASVKTCRELKQDLKEINEIIEELEE